MRRPSPLRLRPTPFITTNVVLYADKELAIIYANRIQEDGTLYALLPRRRGARERRGAATIFVKGPVFGLKWLWFPGG